MKQYTNIMQLSTLVFLVNTTWYIVYHSCVRPDFQNCFSTGWYCEGYRLLSPESRRLCVKSLPLPPPSAPVSVPSHLAIYQKIDRKQTSMPPAHVHSKSNRYWGHHFNFPWAIIYCPLPSHHCSSFLLLRRPSAPQILSLPSTFTSCMSSVYRLPLGFPGEKEMTENTCT